VQSHKVGQLSNFAFTPRAASCSGFFCAWNKGPHWPKTAATLRTRLVDPCQAAIRKAHARPGTVQGGPRPGSEEPVDKVSFVTKLDEAA